MADLVAAFLSEHELRMEWWPWGRALLAAFLSGREALSVAMATSSEAAMEKVPSFGVLHHLTERAAEHIAGAIVCFATKNAASAEVGARTSFEVGVNVRYIVKGDRNSRVVAWIKHYVMQDEKQITEWEKALGQLSPSEREIGTPRIGVRRRVHALRRSWLSATEAEFAQVGPLNVNEPWPSIINRFALIGEAVAYRTTYARLSSQTHADAEDTLSYIFLSSYGDGPALQQMAEENIAFRQYLIGYSTHFYLETLQQYCDVFSLKAPPALQDAVDAALWSMREVADQWNW